MVQDSEGDAWAIQVMGQLGPTIRSQLATIAADVHDEFAGHQIQMGLNSGEPYGLIWLGLPNTLVEVLGRLAGVGAHRPRRGRYSVPLVNGVPIVPWRYAKDATTDIDTVPFGDPVSSVRKAFFRPVPFAPSLPFEDVANGNDDGETDRDAMEIAAGLAELFEMRDGLPIAIVAYASNPVSLFRCLFGYATLNESGFLEWWYREELVVPSSPRLRSVDRETSAFDAGQPPTPPLRPRSPLEGPPTGEPPVDPSETGSDE